MNWITGAAAWLWNLSRTTKLVGGAALFGVVIGGCTCNCVRNKVGTGGDVGPFGAKLDPAAVQAVITRINAQGRTGRFADEAPGLKGTGEGKTIVLHDAAKKALGAYLQSQFQPRGTCVSRGAKRIVDLTQCVAIAQGEAFTFHYVSHAYIYGTCREHGHDLSNEDGAVGAWAAWSVNNDGCLSNEDVGDDDNKDDLAVKWGARGVPAEIKEKGRKRLVKRVALAKSFDEVRDAIANGYGCTIASNVGYEGNGGFHRDDRGFCRRGGRWSHQMCFTGYRADLDALLQDQSWGEKPDGPLGSIPIPKYSFWVSRQDAEAQIREGDCWIFSNFDGWPARNIDWIVQAPAKPQMRGRNLLAIALAP